MLSGQLYERATWVRPTAESESSSWPTTDAGVFNDGQSVEAWASRKEHELAKRYNGNGGGTTLAMAVRLWPTATAGDGKSSGSRNLEGSAAHAGISLTDMVLHGNSTTPRRESWATPTARDWKNGQASLATSERNSRPLNEQVQWRTPTAYSGEHQPGLAQLDMQMRQWATPMATDAVKGAGNFPRGNPTLAGQARQWATPQARDEKGPTGSAGRSENGGKRSSLSDQAMPGATAGRLSPDWVEALMGFPQGWTAIPKAHAGPPRPAMSPTPGSRPARSRARAPTGPRASARSATPSSPPSGGKLASASSQPSSFPEPPPMDTAMTSTAEPKPPPTWAKDSLEERIHKLPKAQRRAFDLTCVGHDSGHDPRVIHALAKKGLVKIADRTLAGHPPVRIHVPVVPTAVHMAWAAVCSYEVGTIEEEPADVPE